MGGERPGLLIRDLKTRINGLDVKGNVTLQKSRDSPPTIQTKDEATPASPPGEDRPTVPIVSDGEDESSADAFSLVRTRNNLLAVEYDHEQPPLLEVDIVSGPPESADKLQIAGKLSGSDFSWHRRAVKSASMDFGFSGSQLEIGRIRFAGLGGELDLPFTVAAGKIASDAGRLTSRRVSASLTGSVDWVNDRVEILAGVNLSGLVGIVTSIASPLRENFIEVAGRGTFDKVEWGRRRSQDRRANRKAQKADLASRKDGSRRSFVEVEGTAGLNPNDSVRSCVHEPALFFQS